MSNEIYVIEFNSLGSNILSGNDTIAKLCNMVYNVNLDAILTTKYTNNK